MEIPANLLMSSGNYAYVAVKASLHASDSSVFGLNEDETVALVKRFNNYKKDVINGILLKAAPIEVVNALGQLGYRVVGTTVMCECGGHSAPNSASQSLDELEFERGLWSAAQYGELDRAAQLLARGFEVDRKDAAGYTALHYAARNGHLDICKLLLDKGARVDAVTCHGRATSLHRAATAGKFEIVKFLVERKANVRVKDADGKTALHRGAASKHFEICEYLLKIDPGLKNESDDNNKRAVDYVQTTELLTLLS